MEWPRGQMCRDKVMDERVQARGEGSGNEGSEGVVLSVQGTIKKMCEGGIIPACRYIQDNEPNKKTTINICFDKH